MKTSFYFVVWIAIYPLLGLLHVSFIEQNALVVALLAVFGLSWLLNRSMPETLAYERVRQAAPVMEEVFTGDIGRFRKRITRQAIAEAFTSIYLLISTLVILLSIVDYGNNDWVGLIIFALITFSAISRSIKLLKAYSQLKANPSKEEGERIVIDVYRMNYPAYAEQREGRSYEEMFPPKPTHFKVFQVFSMIVSGICVVLGLVYIVLGLSAIFGSGSSIMAAIAEMYLLYGSLATYYGIKDLIS